MNTMEVDLIWEEPPCAICGSQVVENVFSGPDRLEKLPGSFTIVRCAQCGVFRQYPRPAWESLLQYYPENYTAYNYQDSSNRVRDAIIQYGPRKRLRAIEKYLPKGKMLEVGCGTGGFLEQAILSGHWETTGIEPNPAAASHLRKKFGVPIFHGRLSEAPFAEQEFDAVVMWFVIEHLSDPAKDLAQISKLLKPNGWLFFSMPHFESLESKIFREFWAGWDLPRHLYIYPRPQIRQILEQLGFHVAGEKCVSTSYDILGHSIDFWSQSWEPRHPKLKNLLMKAYRSWIMKAALIAPLAVLDRLTLTSTITLFAQKE